MSNLIPPEPIDAFISNALTWAHAHLGSPAYAGRCLSFVEDAIEQSNHIEMFGGASAHESAMEYNAAAHTEAPPRGAFVFYDWIGTLNGERKNWGHVGLALGDGQIIHAWDVVRVDAYTAIENLSAADGSHPIFLGWVPPTRYLENFRRAKSS